MKVSAIQQRIACLVAITVSLSVVWLVFLPAYAEQPAMRDHLKWLDEEGIDPSAMYYTELPIMEDFLARQLRESRQQRDTRGNETARCENVHENE